MTTASPFWRVAAVAWAAAIFVSGVVPTSSTVHAISDGHDTLTTTVAHFVAYAVLGFLLGVALGGWRVDAGPPGAGPRAGGRARGGDRVGAGTVVLPRRAGRRLLVDVAGAAVGLVVFSVAAWVTRPRSRLG